MWLLGNGPRIAQAGAASTGLTLTAANAGPANARAAATIGRLTATFEGNIDKLDDLHLGAAARELAGEVVKRTRSGRPYDHITEVRNAMQGMRNVIRGVDRLLAKGRPTDEQRAQAEALRQRAIEALKKAQEALASQAAQ